jgi:hypothetical protein
MGIFEKGQWRDAQGGRVVWASSFRGLDTKGKVTYTLEKTLCIIRQKLVQGETSYGKSYIGGRG